MMPAIQMPHPTHANHHGFTLIELSIVLVIIGLLVGGVLGGQSLIRNAQMQTIISDLNKYKNATTQFKDQYNGLPGDLADASDYWGAADGTTGLTAACYNSAKAGKPTCNGNGDGNIDLTNTVTAVSDGSESYLAWQHLANADLINGAYSGTPSFPGVASGYGTKGGTNAPMLKLGRATIVFQTLNTTYSADATFFDGTYKNVVVFSGDCKGVSGCFTGGGILNGQELWNIDTKIDDGTPGKGQMRTWKTWTNCVSGSAYIIASVTTTDCAGFIGLEPIQ